MIFSQNGSSSRIFCVHKARQWALATPCFMQFCYTFYTFLLLKEDTVKMHASVFLYCVLCLPIGALLLNLDIWLQSSMTAAELHHYSHSSKPG